MMHLWGKVVEKCIKVVESGGNLPGLVLSLHQ